MNTRVDEIALLMALGFFRDGWAACPDRSGGLCPSDELQ